MYIKGQFKKAVARELINLRAKEKNMKPEELLRKDRKRLSVHPTVRRTVGKFRRKLRERTAEKQKRRKSRLRRKAVFYRN